MLLFAGYVPFTHCFLIPFYCFMANVAFVVSYSRLKDDCLSATTTSCPLIESLILMSCPSVGPDGLYSLCSLPNLTTLDLSYTFLTNLEPIFESCTQLKVIVCISESMQNSSTAALRVCIPYKECICATTLQSSLLVFFIFHAVWIVLFPLITQ